MSNLLEIPEIPEIATKSFNIYFSKDYNAYIIDYYISEKLPLNGWIKPCMYCNKYTSKYIIKSSNTLQFVINLCKKCQFNNKINNKIDELLLYIIKLN
jgi:hypothetical protein